MEAIQQRTGELWALLVAHGFEDAFGDGDTARVECPRCNAPAGLKLSLRTGQARCSNCGVEAPIRIYLSELEDGEVHADPDSYSEANVIPLRRDRGETLPAVREEDPAPAVEDQQEDEIETWRAELLDEPGAARGTHAAEPQGWAGAEAPGVGVAEPPLAPRRRGVFEALIIILLSLVFLGAGLAAAGLSAFANFQAFSASVAEPVQGRIWGWAGVIASVCSFGGFTFFWWHVSGGRRKEGVRALVFALAGAATSVLGTAMYMETNRDVQAEAAEAAGEARAVIEAQIADYRRQLDGIPPETRSVEGLEEYLRGVEDVGRTWQKPYRDAQNELGLAKRRAALEAKIETARQSLLGEGGPEVLDAAAPARGLPAWFFAVMLEVFSSQATSIAFVALLVLASGRARARRVA
ncbi:hypothetical protein [Henriciella aquimarina]|uniref:hypothetical protein n=1 Tax=Henriciella aquimarina TaxID=545261 RepID=UPI000A008A79|nr:hypothetical protein [Henriciella aquimarina]